MSANMAKIYVDMLRAMDNELERISAQHPPYHSRHEGIGVLAEEYEEVKRAFDELTENMKFLWRAITWDASDKTYLNDLNNVKVGAIKTASECIQVMAVAERMEDVVNGQGKFTPRFVSRTESDIREEEF